MSVYGRRSRRLFYNEDTYDMTRKTAWGLLSILILLVSGCTTVPSVSSGIWITEISESVTRYYFPATTWSEKAGRSVICRLDMTYIDEPGRPVVCNISFFNKNAIPKEASFLSFTGNGKMYPLKDISIMLTRAEYNELRITSVMEIEELLHLFQSEEISLKAIIDSIEYEFEANEEFMSYCKQFLDNAGGR